MADSFVLLILGFVSFFAAVIWTFAGKERTRSGWVYRAQEPIVCWSVVATYLSRRCSFHWNFLAFLPLVTTTVQGLSKAQSRKFWQ